VTARARVIALMAGSLSLAAAVWVSALVRMGLLVALIVLGVGVVCGLMTGVPAWLPQRRGVRL
jgi:hypothetical protein